MSESDLMKDWLYGEQDDDQEEFDVLQGVIRNAFVALSTTDR